MAKRDEAEEKRVMKHKMRRLDKIYTGHIWANTRTCEACWKCLDVCPNQVHWEGRIFVAQTCCVQKTGRVPGLR